MILVISVMTLFLFQTTRTDLTQFKVTLFQTYAALKELNIK